MRFRFLIILLLAATASPVCAQDFYEVSFRPRNVHYQLIRSEHFDLIYQSGSEQLAREAGGILESEFDSVRALVGLKRQFRMPVVLNGYTDVAGGRVTPLAFRQEIETVTRKGKYLHPGYPDWMTTVLPHELVHAAHAEIRPWFGFGGLLSLFSRDLSRALNFSMPPGMTEGVAIYHESRILPGVGRLHYSFYNMRYRAAMTSSRPWSLSQMMEASAYSLPYNRHYIGGGHVFQYLANEHGLGFFATSARRFNRWPFFGYGFSLWTATGRPPWSIQKSVRRAAKEIAIGSGFGETDRMIEGRRGLNHYRPKWYSDHEILTYIDGYDVRRGFYIYDVVTGERRLISTQSITEDRYFSLSPERSRVLFSRYVPSATSELQATADLFQLDIRSRKARKITNGAHVHAPVSVGNSTLWAGQNRGQFVSWVRLGLDGKVERLDAMPRAVHKEFAVCPSENLGAVLVGMEGQSLILFVETEEEMPVAEPMLVRDAGSLYDIAWSPGCRYLLFTSDPEGKPDVFAFDRASGETRQLTDAPYGAFEASVSANGKTLAFIDYQHERRDLHTIRFAPETAVLVADSVFRGALLSERTPGSQPQVLPTVEGEPHDYRAGLGAVRPRILYPTVDRENLASNDEDVDLGWAFGVKMEGSDPLETWSWGAHGFYQADKLWGEVSVKTARKPWRPGGRIYVTPSTQLVRLLGTDVATSDTVRIGRYERGIEFNTTLPLTVYSNVYLTAMTARLGAIVRQTRFMDDGAGLLDEYPSATTFTTRATLRPAFSLAYRIQSNPRDLVPNTGLVFRSSAELDIWAHKEGAENMESSRAWLNSLTFYLPLSLRWHQSVRLEAAVITQNAGSIYDLDRWVPRGYENDLLLGAGTWLKGSVQYTTPLWFIDNGFVMVPTYFKVLLAYAFAETIVDSGFNRHWSSVGVGLGLDVRIAHALSLTLRLAAAWQIEDREWVAVFR